MKKTILVGAILFLLSVSNVFAQSAQTFTISLNGSALNTTSALNITINFTEGSAQLDSGATFKANGAAQLLTDVNATTNVITVVWSGSITDGKATVTAKLKPGSISGSPKITVTKVEAAGGKDITSQVTSVVSQNISQPTPEPTPTPEATTPTPTPTPKVEANKPSIDLTGPEVVELKERGSTIFKLTATGKNFTSTSVCKITSSDNFLLRVRPSKFLLSPLRKSRMLIGRVSSTATRDIIDFGEAEEVDVEVSCKNGATDNLTILLEPPL